MSDKCSFRECPRGIAPPRTAWELLMEKQRLHPDISMYFTDYQCPICEMPIYTDGKTEWCKRECPNDGRSVREYMGFIKEMVR